MSAFVIELHQADWLHDKGALIKAIYKIYA